MRLIVEKIKGSLYVYRETEKHFKKLGRKDLSDPKLLDNNCEFSNYPDGTCFVFRIKKKPVKK